MNGGEEIGFLPPVSGGAGKKGTEGKRAKRAKRARKGEPRARVGNARVGNARRSVPAPRKGTKPAQGTKRRSFPTITRDYLVTAQPLSLDALVARVAHPGAGGIAVFLGVVRDNAHDKAVKYLEYEAYPELAERMLAQIGAEVQARWSDVRLAIAHRTGRMEIGAASVIIAASAPHRAEAFAACRYAIERLKVILPVWKKEFASDTDYWVEGPTPGDVPTDTADAIVANQEDEFGTQKKFGVLSASDEGGGEIRTDVESV
ncbi:MAG: molybdenum cofactor biosynthesis protein MoaE [Chloroflexi bacterium]|nr:molybdenum cofactor biosynthesis protein MoaE [Chloroflexota bacterium]